MARTQKNKQLRPLHLFICEDSKSSKYYMQGLGRAKGINIKAEEADGTSPANVLRSAKEKQKLFKDKGTVQIYCLFDKDDCDDEKFKKAIQQCRKAGFVDAVSVPCYEYWLLLHLKKTNQPFRDAKECCETFQSEYNKQVFVVMLKDKLKYITGKHNLIELNKPILDKTKYDELLGEFTYMRKL